MSEVNLASFEIFQTPLTGARLERVKREAGENPALSPKQ